MLDRRSSGRFTHQRARVGPRLWSRIRKQLLTRSFVLATWSPCRGPRRSAASELAVVPSATPGSPSSNAWTARLRHARPRHIPRPNSLRALHRVPSSAGVCAYSQARQWAETGGSAFEIKTGSESQIAIRCRLGKLPAAPGRAAPVFLHPLFAASPTETPSFLGSRPQSTSATLGT